MNRIFIPLIVCVTVALVQSDLSAQNRVPHYRRTPVISPHVNLFRADNAGLNSFIGAYSPRVQMQQFMNNTSQQIQYQQKTLIENQTNMDRDVRLAVQQQLKDGGGSMLQMRPSSSGGTGTARTAGTFMGHGRYYPGSGGGGGGGRRVPMPSSGRALGGGGTGGFGGGF